MPKLSKCFAPPRTIEMPLGDGECLQLQVDVSRITPAFLKQVDTEKGEAGLMTFICGTVVAWDAQDDAGNIYELVPDVLMNLPMAFLKDLVFCIQESLTQGNGTSSPG